MSKSATVAKPKTARPKTAETTTVKPKPVKPQITDKPKPEPQTVVEAKPKRHFGFTARSLYKLGFSKLPLIDRHIKGTSIIKVGFSLPLENGGVLPVYYYVDPTGAMVGTGKRTCIINVAVAFCTDNAQENEKTMPKTLQFDPDEVKQENISLWASKAVKWAEAHRVCANLEGVEYGNKIAENIGKRIAKGEWLKASPFSTAVSAAEERSSAAARSAKAKGKKGAETALATVAETIK